MEVGEEGERYTYHYTVTTRMTCSKMGSDENHFNQCFITSQVVEGQSGSQDSVHKPQLLKRKESRSGIETMSFRLPAYRLTARPNRLSRHPKVTHYIIVILVTGLKVTCFHSAS